MKLWIAATAGLLAMFVGSSGASAQWSNQRYDTHVRPAPGHYDRGQYDRGRYDRPPPVSRWQEQTAAAAHRLEAESVQLAQTLMAYRVHPRLARDARQLATDANHFHRSVERSASRQHAVEDFRQVAESFHEVRRGLIQTRALRRVTPLRQSFGDVAQAFRLTHGILMGGPNAWDRYGPRYYEDPYDDGYGRWRDRYGYDDGHRTDDRYGYDDGYGEGYVPPRRPYRPRRAPQVQLRFRVPG